ncbi:MAG: hypothetical protein ABFD49_08905 [Armatimonadota bacterium]|nr:hypothetical protein [bacterium]
MRGLRIFVSLLIIPACFCQGAWALGKTTVDPNTLPQKQQKDIWQSDSRLTQTVTYEARRKTVLSIMNDLTNMTGVTLHTGYNSKDWQVRDRKMLIFAKVMPLKDLMQSVARVMKFQWTRSESQPYTYRIYMDRRTLLDAEGQAYRAEQKYNEMLVRKREALADRLSGLSGLNPTQLENLRADNPYLYTLAKTGMANPLSQLFQQLPEARNAFVSCNSYYVPASQLPESLQQTAIDLVKGMSAINSIADSEQLLPDNLEDMLDQISIRLAPSDDGWLTSDPRLQTFVLGTLNVKWPQEGQSATEYGFPLLDPDSSLGKGMGNYLADALNGDLDPTQSGWSFTIFSKELESGDFGEEKVEHKEKYAELEKEISPAGPNDDKNEIRYKSKEEVIARIAEMTGMNVISDYLGESGFDYASSTKTITFNTFIDGFAKTFDCNWWKSGSVLEFRDRYWFKKRSKQIPEEYLEKWRKFYKLTGTLNIDNLSEMATLAGEEERYNINIKNDEVLDNGSMHGAIYWQIDTLRFYASLDDKQRNAVVSQDGLKQDTLSEQQMSLLSKAAYIDDPAKPIVLSVSGQPATSQSGKSTAQMLAQAQVDKQSLYQQAYGTVRLMLWTPKYEPPKKEEQANDKK